MTITLGERTPETVRIFFHQSRQPDIRRYLPLKAATEAEALADYQRTLLPGARSYGRIILADGRYVGDVWCYAMAPGETPQAMLSYCVWDTACWRQGVATQAAGLFMEEISRRFGIRRLGAFTCADNAASLRVLEKCGFQRAETLSEDGVLSYYYEWSAPAR